MSRKIRRGVGSAVVFAWVSLVVGCASKPAPEAKTPEAPPQNAAELSLLGLSSDGSATQVTNDTTKAKAAPQATADDGSDIVPPFSSGPPKKGAAKKGTSKGGKKRK